MVSNNSNLSKKYVFADRSITEFSNRFGEKVRNRRQALGITQGSLVNALLACGIKVSQGYLSLIEGGERQEPNIKIIIALAILLDISLDETLSENDTIFEGDK